MADIFLRKMNWDISRDGPEIRRYTNSYWTRNLVWNLMPSIFAVFWNTSSDNPQELQDLEANTTQNIQQSSPNASETHGQVTVREEGTDSLKKGKSENKTFVLIFRERSGFKRLSHTDLSGTCKHQIRGGKIIEHQTERVESNSNQAMSKDMALFLSIRNKLLRKQILRRWKWLVPLKVSKMEFWEVRFHFSSHFSRCLTVVHLVQLIPDC